MYSVRDSRPGAGEALRREIAVPKRLVPGPPHPQPPSPPRRERASARGWRWLTMAALGLVTLLSAWAFGPGGYVARTATRDLTPVVTVVSVGGRVDARLGTGAAWAPLQRGDVLRAGADIRTTAAGAVELVTADGIEAHVRALSRVDLPDARTIRFQFGRLQVDTRRRAGAGSGVEVAIALTDVRLPSSPALFTLTRLPRGAELRVLDGELRGPRGDVVASGECRVAVGAGRAAALPPCR